MLHRRLVFLSVLIFALWAQVAIAHAASDDDGYDAVSGAPVRRRGSSSRLIGALTMLGVSIGTLVLRSRGLQPDGSAPGRRIVLHYPRSGPSPLALQPTTDRTFILDRTLALAWQQKDRTGPGPNDTNDTNAATAAALAALGDVDWRWGDTVAATLAGPQPGRLPLDVKVVSAAYDQAVAALTARGVHDPEIVAEALLSARSGDTIPTLVTVDQTLVALLLDTTHVAPTTGQWIALHGMRLRVLVLGANDRSEARA